MRNYKTNLFYKRQYEWLAEFVRSLPTKDGVLETVRQEMANALTNTNPHYNRSKFWKACTPEE